MRTQAIAMVVAAPLLALGSPQAAAYTSPYYEVASPVPSSLAPACAVPSPLPP